MFLEQAKASFIAQGTQMAAQMNGEAEREFIQAAQNWARNGGHSPEPVAAMSVVAEFSFDDNFELRINATSIPVSNFDPKVLMPKFGTDTDAVGGLVGGTIPAKPGKFYAVSSSSPALGQIERVGDRTFQFVATTPFNRFWVEIT